jgi:predicted ATPase/DNA-binding CsgD family transcriptional regulator
MAVLMVDRRVGNLPVDVTSFVGRRREVADVKGALSVSRLVTLTGMGGVGKTRLALRVAADLHRGFGDGVWLVELAGLQDAGLVGQTVAASLGFHDQSSRWSVVTLSELLTDRQLLLVLDNCEHLIDACAVVADALLRACPRLRILATSRQPLGITGEHTLSVPPLSLPGPDRPVSLEGLAQFEAVSLFVDRASAVHPGFSLDAGNQLAVAGICRRLDGIPLAVELAAGRMRALSADQLLTRLDDRYGLLTGGSRAALPRQQTLRALVDWSFELCSAAERLLWARLSVFAAGFDLDAAEEVCSGDEIPADAVLDLVAALVDKSILLTDDGGGRPRYQLPETLREYGRDRLEEYGQIGALRRRHRDWCRRLVAFAESTWFGADQVELLARLRLEHANLRAALNFCLTEPGESPTGLAIASALRFYWMISGRLNEGRHWLDRLLNCASAQSPTRLKALCVDAYLATLLGDVGAAVPLVEEARQLAEQLDDASGAAYVAQIRGLEASFHGDPAGAAQLLKEALATHRRLGDLAAIGYDQALLAAVLSVLEDDVGAAALFEECLATTESAGEFWVRALALWAVGIQACRLGDCTRATEAERQSIRLRRALDNRYGIALNLDVLAWTATVDGDAERAARLFGAAHAIMQAVGAASVSSGPTGALHVEYEATAREALGDNGFARAFEHGLRVGFDQALAYALGESTLPRIQPTATQRATAVPGSLTRREREVAELIMQGLSNKQIADTLVMAQRTAEGHVEHILTKLGFTTRSQVAAWVAERRATPGHG